MAKHGLIDGKYRHEDGLWDDVRIPGNIVINVAGPFEPIFLPFLDDGGGSIGTGLYWYDIGQYSFFTVQIPHDWKEGTPVYPHIHWSTDAGAGPGDVAWLIEYCLAAPMAPFIPPATVLFPSLPDSVAGPYFHHVAGWSSPIDMTGYTLSTQLICRIERIASASALPPGGPDYGGGIALIEIDFHYQKNDLGSTFQWVKG
jgi:hypothetical protein